MSNIGVSSNMRLIEVLTKKGDVELEVHVKWRDGKWRPLKTATGRSRRFEDEVYAEQAGHREIATIWGKVQ